MSTTHHVAPTTDSCGAAGRQNTLHGRHVTAGTAISSLRQETKEMAMRIAVTLIFALVLAATGLHMLIDPAGWYGIVPGVPDTGPLNPHFVRDIGCAYLMSGVAFAWLAFDER